MIDRGPMPLADVLPIAKQIADALEAAHEQGIVHRDLKPANIKVKADGTVKVLDFGLAKALGPEGGSAPDLMNSPTLTVHATQMGMIIGTAAYMAPEQARGRPVDRRADIWAFGVVLYEMLTGRRAFDGDDVSITLANVLKEDPKWQRAAGRSANAALSTAAPLSGERAEATFERDRRRAARARGARTHERGHAAAPLAAPRISMLSRLWPAVAGIVITAAAAAIVWPSAPSPTSAGVARVSILPPPGETVYPDSTRRGRVARRHDGRVRRRVRLHDRKTSSGSGRSIRCRRAGWKTLQGCRLAVLVTGRPSHRILHEFQAEGRHRGRRARRDPGRRAEWPRRHVEPLQCDPLRAGCRRTAVPDFGQWRNTRAGHHARFGAEGVRSPLRRRSCLMVSASCTRRCPGRTASSISLPVRSVTNHGHSWDRSKRHRCSPNPGGCCMRGKVCWWPCRSTPRHSGSRAIP